MALKTSKTNIKFVGRLRKKIHVLDVEYTPSFLHQSFEMHRFHANHSQLSLYIHRTGKSKLIQLEPPCRYSKVHG